MSKRILIIDDEANIRQLTRLTLEAAGYEVGEAESSMEALAILGSDISWDVVLLDQKMPGLSGTELLRRLRVIAPLARTIMVTAFASVELAVEAMKPMSGSFWSEHLTDGSRRL
jgi:two-component system response regulator AtoC